MSAFIIWELLTWLALVSQPDSLVKTKLYANLGFGLQLVQVLTFLLCSAQRNLSDGDKIRRVGLRAI